MLIRREYETPVNMLTVDRPVDGVDGVPGSEEAAVAAVALVDEGVAARPALDHRVEVPARPLARVLLVALRRALVLRQAVQQCIGGEATLHQFYLFKYVILVISH